MATKINHKEIDAVIKKNLKHFRKPGAILVRPGFMISGGWITDKPGIVVTVDKKLKGLKSNHKLPSSVGDLPVDVREATGMQRLRKADPESHSLVVAHGRTELNEPHWKFERSLPDGKLISEAPKIKEASPKSGTKKTQIKYSAPAGTSLAPVTGTMTVIAHASPDDGFPMLTNFIRQTKSNLAIAIYDFTSADILKEITTVIKTGKIGFKMIQDHPPMNPNANQPNDATRETILKADSAAMLNWALTRNDPVATEWIYPSAYHIKVVVQDDETIWLSSGNFNVSNQPNFAAGVPSKGNLEHADRDWHLIIQNKELAKLYKAYINNDFAVAKNGQGVGSEELHKKIQAAFKKLAAKQKKSSKITGPAKPFVSGKHKIFSDLTLTVQPLLTPDPGRHTSMYVDKVLELITSAKKSIYMQTQYVHPSDKPADKDFMLLVQALSNAHKKGLDVRLITSQFENSKAWIEKLKPFDIDRFIRIQKNVHNKGIVVDSKIVLVSSQNWSSDGVLRNRDAGLIIDNADIAVYFENIFLDDWVTRAEVKLVDVSHPVKSKK